jgi:DNA polymerase-4
MDAFFAQVELLRHPELRGKPVIVGGSGDPTRRGVVSTASYEARKFGVRSAMPLRTALRLCPQGVFLPVDYAYYSQVSAKIKAILREFSSLMEDVGIDEAYLDVSSRAESPQELARRIKARIREQTGLSCSVGIGPNKLLAKVASDLQKPDGLTVLTEEDIPRLLWSLPVRKLPGVGPKTEARLKALGIQSVAELAAKTIEFLKEHFGQAYGSYLWYASRGIDHSPIITHWEPKSLSREETFQQDVALWQVLARKMAELLKDVHQGLKQEGYMARTVTVKLRFEDFQTHTRAKTLPEATQDWEELRRTAFQCLGRFQLSKKVRLVGVRLSGLQKVDKPHQ